MRGDAIEFGIVSHGVWRDGREVRLYRKDNPFTPWALASAPITSLLSLAGTASIEYELREGDIRNIGGWHQLHLLVVRDSVDPAKDIRGDAQAGIIVPIGNGAVVVNDSVGAGIPVWGIT